MTPLTSQLSHTELTTACLMELSSLSSSWFTNQDISKLRDMQKFIGQQLNRAIMSTSHLHIYISFYPRINYVWVFIMMIFFLCHIYFKVSIFLEVTRTRTHPPYDIHSQEAMNLDEDKYIKCIMSTMTYHTEAFINAYNVMDL